MNTSNTYIHTGLSKCASTFLQKSIFPQFGNYSNIAFAPEREKYYLFRNNFETDIYLSYIYKHLVNPVENRRHLVVSCEDYSELLFRGFEDIFYHWQSLDRANYHYSNKLITENLARVFPGAKIIFIIRQQLAWALSRHKMNYRGGKAIPDINFYLTEPLETYDITIKRYQDFFGRDNVLVLPYEKLITDAEGFIKNLCEFIDPEITIKLPAEHINKAPDMLREVEYERYKNSKRLEIKHRKNMGPLLRSFRMFSRRILTGAFKPYFYLKYGNRKFRTEISVDTIKKLENLFNNSNREVEKLTGLDLSRHGYFNNMS